jgi:hypothetical protein
MLLIFSKVRCIFSSLSEPVKAIQTFLTSVGDPDPDPVFSEVESGSVQNGPDPPALFLTPSHLPVQYYSVTALPVYCIRW